MQISVKLTDTDKGYKDLVRRVFGKEKAQVSVGIHDAQGGESHGSDGTTVADVATWNEFGTDRIPERSFIRGFFDENAQQIKDKLRKLMEGVVQGRRTKEEVLELLGLYIQGGIQQRIADGIPPPNAPSTIARKGSDKPLIDTGQLRSSVTFKVG